jgi:hypothetical protein
MREDRQKWVWVCLPCLTQAPPATEESFVARGFESHPPQPLSSSQPIQSPARPS